MLDIIDVTTVLREINVTNQKFHAIYIYIYIYLHVLILFKKCPNFVVIKIFLLFILAEI